VSDPGKRAVYSTRSGRLCGKCSSPETDCRCSSNLRAREEPVPQKITARLSIEKRGSGKIVTVADGLPRNAGFLAGLARELKKSCGTGGRAGVDFVEIQGDHRERLRELHQGRGWRVKG